MFYFLFSNTTSYTVHQQTAVEVLPSVTMCRLRPIQASIVTYHREKCNSWHVARSNIEQY